MIGICFVFGGLSALTILLAPIFSWFDLEVTQLDTNYWSLRYLTMLVYIIGNAVLSVFPHVHNFLFFVTDGLLLSQLTSLYLYNEFSMSALLSILPVMFVIHNHLLVKGIQSFVKHEQAGKMSFVRLIGRHDAVFLFVIYSLFTTIFTIVDMCASNIAFASNLWYILYALYAFARLMNHKNSQGKWLYRLSLLTVLVFTAVYIWTLSFQKNPFPERTFPLYLVQNVTANSTEDINVTTNGNETIIDETSNGNVTVIEDL